MSAKAALVGDEVDILIDLFGECLAVDTLDLFGEVLCILILILFQFLFVIKNTRGRNK